MIKTIISQTCFAKTSELLRKKYNEISEDGTFFAITYTEYDSNGNVIHDFLDCIRNAIDIGYSYINTIVVPRNKVQNYSFLDNVIYIVWLCKNPANMYFDKDAIREKHIWKDVEWGHRAKNYNPKGKDPGNVWIPTLDDGKAHITKHILLDKEDIINRLIRMTNSEGQNEVYLDEIPSSKLIPCKDNGKVQSYNTNPHANVYYKSSETMNEIDDGIIKAIVTSPPYWNLKDYFKQGQIGQEPYEKYLLRMKSVWSMCYKKLCSTGSMWININIRSQKGNVILLPYDFVQQCREIGFYYKGVFIWHKSSGIPTGAKNIVDRHEYVLLFSKEENFTVNKSIQQIFTDYKNSEISGKNFWNINRKAGSVGKKFIHPAIYPNDLVYRILQLTTEKGDNVMDPFLGSGTSLIAALSCDRNFYGYEYNEGFDELIKSRALNELGSINNIKFIL